MDKALETMIANLEKNTGKSLEQWVAIVRSSGLARHGEIIKFLKSGHGFTHGFANLVAHQARNSGAAQLGGTTDLVAGQYEGKEALRPLYEQLIAAVRKFGTDVEIAPKKAYVSLRRNKQFAILQPSTKSRLDIGLNLKEVTPEGPLENAGKWNAMCTHRLRITKPEEINEAVIRWLKVAYDQS